MTMALPPSRESLYFSEQYSKTVNAFVNKKLKSLNGMTVSELGKAVVATGGKWYKSKAYSPAIIAEAPKYNIQTYQRMYERVDLLNEMVNKFSESLVESGFVIGPPDYLLQDDEFDLKTNGPLSNNILHLRRWSRFINFPSFMVNYFKPALWAGNSYAEMVPEGRDIDALDLELKSEYTDNWGIIGLKIIKPQEMRVVRDATGDVLGYVQYPHHSPFFTTLNRPQARTMVNRFGAIPLEKYDILHLKWNPLPSAPYGMSMFEPLKDVTANVLGIRDDLAITVNNYSIPTTHFRLGTDLIPASASSVLKFIGQLSGLDASSDLVTSTMVDSKNIKDPSKVLDIPVFLRAVLNMLYAGAGVPEILFGQGNETTEATAKMQMEAVDKKFKAMQQLFRDQVELKLFSRITKGIMPEDLKPQDMDEIPQIYFHPFETSEDKRLRFENGVKLGAITYPEYRREYGFLPKRGKDIILDQNADYQMELADKKLQGKMAFGGGMQPNGPPQSTKKDRNTQTKAPPKDNIRKNDDE